MMSMAKILLVDDEEPLRALLCLWLQGHGHEVREAPNGARALYDLEHNQVDVVVCDLLMPDMDGLEVTREARRRGLTMPIIVTSGSSSADLARNMKAVAQVLGATTILAKPFGRDELLDAIKEVTK